VVGAGQDVVERRKLLFVRLPPFVEVHRLIDDIAVLVDVRSDGWGARLTEAFLVYLLEDPTFFAMFASCHELHSTDQSPQLPQQALPEITPPKFCGGPPQKTRESGTLN